MNNEYKKFETSLIASNKISKDIYPTIDSNGDWKQLEGKDAIANSIRTLLMTPLGKYPFDPNYGSLLFKQLFEPQDEITYENIQYEVKDRIEQYEDRVFVNDVNVEFFKDNKSAVVNVEYTIKNERDKTKLSVAIKNLGADMLTDAESLTSSIWM